MRATTSAPSVRSAGIWLAITSAALFGASTPIAKFFVGVISPWLLAGLLYTGAGLGLFAIVGFQRWRAGGSQEAPLRRHDLPWLCASVLFGGVIAPLCLMFGLVHSSAASVSLLLNVEGVATMSIAWLVFRENVDRRLLIGAIAIVVGATTLSWTNHGVALDRGSLFVLGACLGWGIDNNLTRKISAADPVRIAMLKGFPAGLINLSLAYHFGASWPSAATTVSVLVVGFLGYGVSLVLFVFALRDLGTARTGAYFSLAPFIGTGMALLVLHEPLTLALVFASACMGVGLWLHLSERHEHSHVHEALEHEHAHVHDEHHQHFHEAGERHGKHTHWHTHDPLIHSHPHYPDLHHRHRHGPLDQAL